MNSKLLIFLGCASYILSQHTGGNFLRAPVANSTDTPHAEPVHAPVAQPVAPTTHTAPTPSPHRPSRDSDRPHHPMQTMKCVIKGEWFQKCVNSKDTVKWNEQYKRTDHCFRFGICQLKDNKCEWTKTKEMSDCLDDIKKSKNKIITE